MLDALRHRNFRWYWFSNIWQAAAIGMQFLVLGWLVLRLTDDSSTQLGLVIFLYGIPNLGRLIFGGIFADRLNRRLLLVSTMGVVVILRGIFKKCVNSQAVYPLSEQHGLEAQERR